MMDMTLMKMKILFFPNYMHFLQESYLTNKGFGILQHIKLLTLSVENKPEIKHTENVLSQIFHPV
jgi:hypothetical protein